ncbi:MAG: efflux RND transporter permease subunit [bacterium]|nr:efflux RND transporter permease subunit [bacterium]
MIRYFARHPTAANLLMVIIIVLGVMALPGLRRETFSSFAATSVSVTAVWPGAAAEEVEEAVAQRIEDALDGIQGVEEVRSESREGVAVVTVEMADDAEFTTFLSDVQAEVDGISDFPADVEDPVISRLGDTQAVVSIAVTGPMSTADLKAYSELLKRELQLLDRVSLVEVSGFSDHQIQIEISNAAMMQYGLSVRGLANTIANQSVDIPAGVIETRDGEILVRFANERRSPSEFEGLIISGGTQGGEIKLGDIAKIRDTFADPEDKVTFNGERAGILKISKTTSQDSLDIMADLRDFLAAKERTKPPEVKLTMTEDVSSIAQDRLELLTTNAVQGLVLVFGTLWLFLNVRLAFWVAAGLPVSFLGALFVMGQIDYSLNMITMLALLLALGLLMDDGIVLAENVARRLQEGAPPMEAAIEGVRQVSPGVLSSFTTTVCVFLPMAFLEGDIGKVLLVLPVVLIIVLAVSLIEAFCILPGHLGHSLRPYDPSATHRFRRRFDGFIDVVRERWLGRAVDAAISWRYATAGGVVMVFLLCVGLIAGGVLKFQAFPDVEGNVVQARILLPQGTTFDKTEQVVERLTRGLEIVDEEFAPRQPDRQRLVQNVSIQYNTNADAFESGPHVATISVDLLGAEIRDAPMDEIINRWRDEAGILSDVIALKFTEPGFGPSGRPIQIEISGDDLDELKRVSIATQEWLRPIVGVLDLSDDLRPGKPEVNVRLRHGAASLDIQAASIGDQLRAAFQGSTAREIQVGTEGYEIDVSLANADASTLADLEYFQVEVAPGKHVPLGAIAALAPTRGFARVAHVDGRRTVTLTGDVDTQVANTAEVIAALRSELVPDLQERHSAVRIHIAGEAEESGATMASMGRGLLLGLFGVFVLLSFQFRSYVEPIIVMVAIPFAMIGVVAGHLLMGFPLTMPGMLGFVSLAGIVVNDSILLVEFVKLEHKGGRSVVDSARKAARLRFRAVLLTSLTTAAGLLPLLAERSLQAQILIPLAISIVFGVLASTVLVLIVIPALYAILADFKLNEPHRDHEDHSSSVEPQTSN